MPAEGIRSQYRWLRTTMWLGIEPRTFKEQTMLLTAEPSLSPISFYSAQDPSPGWNGATTFRVGALTSVSQI